MTIAAWAALVLGLLLPQDGGQTLPPLPDKEAGSSPHPTGGIEWQEGMTIPVRVPTAGPGRELMTTIVFPEESIETAITGWPEGEITAIQKRGLLFLRLAHKSEGQLNVIGGSGAHYLLYLTGVESAEPDRYDSYVRIRKKELPKTTRELPKRQAHRPSGATQLLQAMRLGLRPEGARILRTNRELAYESSSLEIRLLFVYDTPSTQGYIYDVRNLSSESLSIDASRLYGKGVPLILGALRENVLGPKAVTRFYAIAWKD